MSGKRKVGNEQNRMPDFKQGKMVCPICGYKLDVKSPFNRMEEHMMEEHPEWVGR